MCSSGYRSYPRIVSKSYCLTDGNPPTLYDCIDLAQRGGGFAGRIHRSNLDEANSGHEHAQATCVKSRTLDETTNGTRRQTSSVPVVPDRPEVRHPVVARGRLTAQVLHEVVPLLPNREGVK
jgi:hypothetical protein